MVPVNYVAVLVAAVVNMVLGALWYGPLFGKQWLKLMGWTKEKIEKEKNKGMNSAYLLMMVGSLFMSFVLSHALVFASTYLGTIGVAAGLMAGFWNWLGFVAPVTVSSVLFEGKSWNLWLLNNGYALVSLLLMGTILAIWV